MKTSRALIALSACAVVAAPGCGSRPAPAAGGPAEEPAVNRRYPMKDEYKKVLGKDGKMLWKPGMKPPAGVNGR